MDWYSGILTLWRFSLVVFFLPTNPFIGECNGDAVVVDIKSTEELAKNLGDRLIKISEHYSGVKYLREAYKNRSDEFNITHIDGADLRDQVRTEISDYLQMKVTAVENIVAALETKFKTFNFSSEPPEEYLNALNFTVNNTEELTILDPWFDSETISLLTNSTIHVPTVVYNKDIELLREISASDVLEEVFKQNLERDYTLKWQYYGSKVGFMRNFPGIIWNLNGSLNLFDCRQRSWYSQAIAPPKTVLFLVDMSGSQTGLAIGMTHLMVTNTIDSLGENDYFNILTFNDTTKFVDECHQDTFLESTYKNKEHMKKKLLEVMPEHESRICEALNAAFDALEEARSGPNSNCSEAIMLFTDGVEDSCDRVFAERNKNRTVRVFTYLLGESNQHARILKKIACTNHGRYTRITVRSDVPEKVADYLPIMGRPLVQEQQHPTVWSNTYIDYLSDELVFTVSQVVHNATVKGLKEGDVAGVASVDIPVKSLLKVVPPYKFGVNGYMFIITNNGYITYHPNRKSMHKGRQIEGVSTQDITDVEQSQQFDQELGSFASEYDKFFGDFDEMQLRRDMIDRKTGQIRFPVERPFENMTRLEELEQTYFYTSIADTPFSLAVVLTEDKVNETNPEKTVSMDSNNKTTGNVTEELKVLKTLMSKDQVKLAEWIPCWLPSFEDSAGSSLEEYFQFFLEKIKNDTDPNIPTVKCNIDWTNLLLLDLRTTAKFGQHWNYLYNITEESLENPFQADLKEQLPYGDETTDTYRYGMFSSFLATVSGLNQYYDISIIRTAGLVGEYPNTVAEDYFARAVNDVKENGFVYSFPPKLARSESDTEEDEEVSVVTAYSAVKENGSTMAVAGHQMTMASFEHIFQNSTSTCDGLTECTIPCSTKGVTCLLIDTHGYVMASSNDESDMGQHLALVEPVAFKDLVERDRQIMYRRSYADYQALCKDNRPSHLQSASSFILSPFSQVKNFVAGFVQNAIIMLTTFSWYDWLLMMVLPSPSSPEPYQEEEIYEPCDEIYTYYLLNISHLEHDAREGYIVPSDGCASDCITRYVIAAVPRTNLALLVLSQSVDCECPGPEPVTRVEEVRYNTTGESMCKEDGPPIYRKPLPGCVKSTRLNEESSECGSASFLQPSKLLLVLATFQLIRFLVA